jgi:hypothetical protein
MAVFWNDASCRLVDMTDVSEEFTASIFMMLTHHSDDGGRKLL